MYIADTCTGRQVLVEYAEEQRQRRASRLAAMQAHGRMCMRMSYEMYVSIFMYVHMHICMYM